MRLIVGLYRSHPYAQYLYFSGTVARGAIQCLQRFYSFLLNPSLNRLALTLGNEPSCPISIRTNETRDHLEPQERLLQADVMHALVGVGVGVGVGVVATQRSTSVAKMVLGQIGFNPV